MSFRTNQIVWAKLASYPHWPSKVVKLSACPKEITDKLGDAEEDNELVFFYGSHNYAWIHRSLIVDWDEGFNEYINNKKAPKSFQQALKEVEKEKEKRERRAREGKENPEEDSESEKSANSGSAFIEDDDKNKKNDSVDKKKPKKPKSESKEGKDSAKKQKKRDPSPNSRSESDEEPKTKKNGNGDTTDKEKQNSTNKSKEDAPFSKKRKIMELVEEREERARQEKSQNDIKSEPPSQLQIATPLSRKQEDRRKLAAPAFTRAIQAAAKHPIAKYLKFEVVHYGEGVAQTKATFSDLRTSLYELHANSGAVQYLLDVTCFLATLTQLYEGDSALTQDFHATIIDTIPPGSEIVLKAKVVCAKENLVFIDGEAWLAGKLCVTARVIKAIYDSNYSLLARESMTPSTPQAKQTPKQNSPVSPPQ